MSGNNKKEREIVVKVVVCGDGAVGKTCILAVYQKGKFPEKYIPTVFENYTMNIPFGERKISATLWDTAGQEDYDKLRPLSYPGTDCFILCFSIEDPISMENIKGKWVPEITKETGGQCKFIVCGTKKDLRDDPKTIEKLSAKGLKPVSKEEGEAFAKEVGAKHYVECSAMNNDGVKQVFDKAFKTGIFEKTPTPSNKGGCIIL